ncbi:MAG: hypothetical protein ACI30R_03195 [Sodaliphilus sp.]
MKTNMKLMMVAMMAFVATSCGIFNDPTYTDVVAYGTPYYYQGATYYYYNNNYYIPYDSHGTMCVRRMNNVPSHFRNNPTPPPRNNYSNGYNDGYNRGYNDATRNQHSSKNEYNSGNGRRPGNSGINPGGNKPSAGSSKPTTGGNSRPTTGDSSKPSASGSTPQRNLGGGQSAPATKVEPKTTVNSTPSQSTPTQKKVNVSGGRR